MTLGKRMREALNAAGVSVKDLERELTEREIPGASYANLQRYLGDEKKRPAALLLHHVADFLDVRQEWLAFGDGERTVQEQELRGEADSASTAASSSKPFSETLAGLLHQDISAKLGLQEFEQHGIGYWIAPASELWFQLQRAPGPPAEAGDMIGEALAGPFSAFEGVDAATMRKERPEEFSHYILAMIPALLLLAKERSRQLEGPAAPKAAPTTEEV